MAKVVLIRHRGISVNGTIKSLWAFHRADGTITEYGPSNDGQRLRCLTRVFPSLVDGNSITFIDTRQRLPKHTVQ